MIKKRLVIFISSLIILILIVILINVYNSYAKKQREKIIYCNLDSDCIPQGYNLNPCGQWSSCFNKDEKPLSDVGIGYALCDYPVRYCKCDNGKCKGIR